MCVKPWDCGYEKCSGDREAGSLGLRGDNGEERINNVSLGQWVRGLVVKIGEWEVISLWWEDR